MPRGPSSASSSSEIRDIVGQFVDQLSALVEQDAVARAREAILSAFPGGGGVVALSGARRRGRPPGRQSGTAMAARDGTLASRSGRLPARKRRKAPIQLCPVPGCTNRAAPVFGMVCAKHKDLPKSEIKKFREARRAQRNQAKGSAKVLKVTAKVSAKAKRKPRPKPKTKPKTKPRTKPAPKKRTVKAAPKPVPPVVKPPVVKPVPPPA
jgi:hypothetical protein